MIQATIEKIREALKFSIGLTWEEEARRKEAISLLPELEAQIKALKDELRWYYNFSPVQLDTSNYKEFDDKDKEIKALREELDHLHH